MQEQNISKTFRFAEIDNASEGGERERQRGGLGLWEEEGVRGYRFVQREGEAVYQQAPSPHALSFFSFSFKKTCLL